ncbi:DNA endonuclease SmrA [Pseudomaricurvus sp. HS19]|uniref:DNA endonuclease SmrA n=1 Tax=Pseudomaricurvus sp. HS19 TaxID=2692626 RepID=UPI00136F138C|nr:DNA endonuclease SmrA [Pseudomaricurvus sp. HS19]MYM64159.1 DNA endonuclease SmrA [Pseudomaricurvus sp. HS19]
MSKTDNHDEQAFRAAMGDVKPLRHASRVTLAKSQSLSDINNQARRESALAQVTGKRNDLSGDFVEQLEPNAILSYQRPGVQHGVFRNLRLGKYAVEARLDLHRHTVEQAREALFRFVKDCLENDIRCALVTHGKGEGREQPALLKSCVAHWLPQLEDVLAFHSAQKHHGAAGATYIMLRKSDRKRQENLERHQRRRV